MAPVLTPTRDPRGDTGPAGDGPSDGQRRRIRLISGAAALVLVAAAVAILTRHHPTPRSAQAYCARMATTTDLSTILASGDAEAVARGVGHLDQAAEVAPAAVEAPMGVLVAYADGLARAMTQTSDARTALRTAMAHQAGQVTAVEAAGRQVSAYLSATCHLSLPTTTATG